MKNNYIYPTALIKKTVIPIGCFACYGHAVDARHSDLSRLTAKETKALMDAFSNSK